MMLADKFSQICQYYGIDRANVERLVANAITGRKCLNDIVPAPYLNAVCEYLGVGPYTTVRSLFDSSSRGTGGLGQTGTSALQAQIVAEAQAQGVPPNLALAVAQQESGFNPNAVNQSSGAIGLFQLMPGTASGLGVDPNNVSENIQGGIAYLKQMLNQFGGDVSLALAGYNAGPGKAQTALASYPETQNYVSSVQSLANTTYANYATTDGLPPPVSTDTSGLTTLASDAGSLFGGLFGGTPGGGGDNTGLYIGLGVLGIVGVILLAS